jgi:GrpB-like predicted nucleotidyltransferase (UPF0157 family)
MILFRDWLRNNAGDRLRYQEFKRELSSREWGSIQEYAEAKTPVIDEIMKKAAPNTRKSCREKCNIRDM